MWLLLLLLMIVIALPYSRKCWRKIALRRWEKALALDKHYPVFQQLYAEVDGFALSKQARAAQDAMEYVYGEITFEPFIALLSLCHPKASTVFYDLGSGTGKAVLACAMVFNISKSCGIECFCSLHKAAISQQYHLRKIPEYQIKADRIEFKKGDFLAAELGEATLIFINSTSYFGEVWEAISKNLEQINPGSLVITTSKPLHSKAFVTIQETEVAMSWGMVSAFIQRRND